MMRVICGRPARVRCGSRVPSSAARGKRGCGKRDSRIAVISARSNGAIAACLCHLDRRQSHIVYDTLCSKWLRDVARITREALRQAEHNPARRPRIHTL
jgi:hypothetical protein